MDTNIYCLPPAGGRIRSQGNKNAPPTASHKGGVEVWADGWAEGEGKGGVQVYEAYEVKQKENFASYSTSPEKEFFLLFMM